MNEITYTEICFDCKKEVKIKRVFLTSCGMWSPPSWFCDCGHCIILENHPESRLYLK